MTQKKAGSNKKSNETTPKVSISTGDNSKNRFVIRMREGIANARRITIESEESARKLIVG